MSLQNIQRQKATREAEQSRLVRGKAEDLTVVMQTNSDDSIRCSPLEKAQYSVIAAPFTNAALLNVVGNGYRLDSALCQHAGVCFLSLASQGLLSLYLVAVTLRKIYYVNPSGHRGQSEFMPFGLKGQKHPFMKLLVVILPPLLQVCQYQKALSQVVSNKLDDARAAFQAVLEHPLMLEVRSCPPEIRFTCVFENLNT